MVPTVPPARYQQRRRQRHRHGCQLSAGGEHPDEAVFLAFCSFFLSLFRNGLGEAGNFKVGRFLAGMPRHNERMPQRWHGRRRDQRKSPSVLATPRTALKPSLFLLTIASISLCNQFSRVV
jgi:hypothetical protein